MRHTKGHTGNRRSHHALKQMNIVKDGESLRLPHRIDETTGMYRGKQIFAPKEKVKREPKAKGPNTEPVAPHVHDHTHEHATAETKTQKGFLGKFMKGGRPKARSGFGGGV